jgi:hypothetical protein
MRRSSDDVSGAFDPPSGSRRTGDGRNAMTVAPARAELLPLAAIVIPFPDRAAPELWLRRLDPVRAVLGLASFPRFVGWEDPKTQAEQFQHLGDVCDRVPVYTAQVPWGPPFPNDLVRTILGAAGIDHSLPLRSAAAWSVNSSAYRPFSAMSSAWVPCSTIWPAAST